MKTSNVGVPWTLLARAVVAATLVASLVSPVGADTTPPTVQSFTPAAGTSIESGTVTFHVWASDESPLRSVKFQLRDPSGNRQSFVNGVLVEDNAPDNEKWASPPMTMGSTGQWHWRAKVVDNSAARNEFVMPWVDIHSGEAATPEPTPPPTPAATPDPTNPPQSTPPPEDDTTPPILQSFAPDANSYTTASPSTFHVWVSDASPIRSVRFQLRDPSGNVQGFVGGNLVEDLGLGHEKWASPPMAFGSGGRWSWRARVTDNSPARNVLTTPWVDVFYLGGDSPIQAAVDMIRSEIEELVGGNPALRPKFLRLGFHDCVGGCDGCVNMDNGDNAGLDTPIDALAPIVAKYAHDPQLTAAIGNPISRADVWALATLVGADAAAPSPPADVTWPMTHVGRVDCADADATGRGGFDHELPSPDLNTHELLAFFSDGFGFTSDEVVAIMGAHSIGTAQRENSGFDGAHGWVNNPNVLANGYYTMIIGGSVDPNNFWDLIHAPQWTQEAIDNSAIGTPSRIQWVHQKEIVDEADDRQAEKIIMLNSDIALVRDLSDHMRNETLPSGEVVAGSVTTCSFRCGGNERLTGCPDRDPPVCPHAAATFDKAAEYAFDNDLFLRDFESALDKMLKNGYTEAELVATGEASSAS